MAKAPKTPPKGQSLIKIAYTDTAFKRWAKTSGIATSKEIDAMAKPNIMRLYNRYLKELKKDFPRMRSDMDVMGLIKN